MLLLAGVVATGCNRRERMRVETIEQPFTLKSNIVMSDPGAAVQLVSGFHDIEQNAWRWSAGKFAVNLGPPGGAAKTGGTIVLRFSIPQVALDRLQTITLSARTGATELGSETYSKPGEHTFRKSVPAAALAGESVVFYFTLDKSLAPGMVDQRELGLIVTSAGLEK